MLAKTLPWIDWFLTVKHLSVTVAAARKISCIVRLSHLPFLAVIGFLQLGVDSIHTRPLPPIPVDSAYVVLRCSLVFRSGSFPCAGLGRLMLLLLPPTC